MTMNIPDLLRGIAAVANVKQVGLAELLGTTQGHVSRMLKERTRPNLDLYEKMLQVAKQYNVLPPDVPADIPAAPMRSHQALPKRIKSKATANRLPIRITPDEYIAEVHALGCQIYCGTFLDGTGQQGHMGVIEHDDNRGYEASDEERWRALCYAIRDSGSDFLDRVSDRLYELGLWEEVN